MSDNTETLINDDIQDAASDVAGQFERVFLAGLGAFAEAQKAGVQTFESLVEQGESFRSDISSRTGEAISSAQDAVRGVAHDAQSGATGLLEQVRERSRVDELQKVFDTRILSSLERIGVPTKADIEAVNQRIDHVISLLESNSAAEQPKATQGGRKKRSARKSGTA